MVFNRGSGGERESQTNPLPLGRDRGQTAHLHPPQPKGQAVTTMTRMKFSEARAGDTLVTVRPSGALLRRTLATVHTEGDTTFYRCDADTTEWGTNASHVVKVER